MQGRAGLFEDRNEALLSDLVAKYPNAVSLEMETFHLLDLARCSKGTVVASACVIALADRMTNDFLDSEFKSEQPDILLYCANLGPVSFVLA